MEGSGDPEDDESKPESPIPGKIQQALQKFQDRLSEKDVQIIELQKKIETLQISGGSGSASTSKSQSPRPISRSTNKEPNARPPTGRPIAAADAAGSRQSKHVRSATATSKPAEATEKGSAALSVAAKSKSVPSSPSKKTTTAATSGVATKAGPSRPQSRQASQSADHSSAGTKSAIPKVGRGGTALSRAVSVDRAKPSRRRSGTFPSRRMAVGRSANEAGQHMAGGLPRPATKTQLGIGARVQQTTSFRENHKQLPLKISCREGRLGRSADSLSTHSADSQTSSAADFVSVSSGASPSPTASVDGTLPAGGEEIIPYAELAQRLKRLTGEHEKLQAQHARLRLCMSGSVDLGSDPLTVSVESRMATSDMCSSNCTSDFDMTASETSLPHGAEHKGQGDGGAREFCKEEVLRLRDELLALQKQKIEVEKQLEERFSRIQELAEEKDKAIRDLTEATSRIDDLLGKLEAVQKDCATKSNRIIEFEKTLTTMEDDRHRLRMVMESSNAQITELQRQLLEKEKSQKYLERESNEIKEFLQAERLTLTEALADAEGKLQKSSSRVAHLQAQLEVKSQSLQELQNTSDKERQEFEGLKSELECVKNTSRDMLLKQGAELSGSSVALSQVVQQLEAIVHSLSTQVEGNTAASGKPSINGHDGDSALTVVLPECDQEISRRRDNDLENASLVNAVLKAVDGCNASASVVRPSTPLEFSNSRDKSDSDSGKDKATREKPPSESAESVSSDCVLASGVGPRLKRDDSALSINSILSDGGDGSSSLDGISQLQASATTGKMSGLLEQVKDIEGLLVQLAKLFKLLHTQHQAEMKKMLGKSDLTKSDLERQLRKLESKVEDLQSRLLRGEIREKSHKREMQNLRDKQSETQAALHFSQSKYNELATEYDKMTDQQIEITQLKDQLRKVQAAKSVVEAEKLAYAEELSETVDKLKAKDNGIMVVDTMNERFTLKKEIGKLKAQLCEKDNEITDLRLKLTKHSDVMRTNLNYAETEGRRLAEILEGVVQTLRDIPEVVASCETLQRLWLRLEPGQPIVNF